MLINSLTQLITNKLLSGQKLKCVRSKSKIGYYFKKVTFFYPLKQFQLCIELMISLDNRPKIIIYFFLFGTYENSYKNFKIVDFTIGIWPAADV